jgi:hypothetical protein
VQPNLYSIEISGSYAVWNIGIMLLQYASQFQRDEELLFLVWMKVWGTYMHEKLLLICPNFLLLKYEYDLFRVMFQEFELTY